ncbi:MAG: 4-hydroxy-tetrahydrodipicolinate synthase [Pseudomonadota bacterium]
MSDGIATKIRGSMPALVTPFAEGEVDWAALERLVERQIEAGTHGLVPAGTTGESATMSHEEHEAVVERVVKISAGRLPVIAGAGSNNTRESIRLAAFAERAGADAILTVAPYYNKPTQDGLYLHFKAIHDAVGLPIILYNVPGRTASDIKPETVARLAELPRVVGLKDASADLGRPSVTRLLAGADFIQLSGEDITAMAFNAAGGAGCISVTANVAPALCAKLQEASLAGDFETARALQDQLTPLHEALFVEPNPTPAKAALAMMGLCRNELRSPLAPATPSCEAQLRAALAHAGLLD